MRAHFFCCKNDLNDFIFPKMAYPASRGPSIFLDKPTYLGRSKGLCSQGKNGYTWNIKVIQAGFFLIITKLFFCSRALHPDIAWPARIVLFYFSYKQRLQDEMILIQVNTPSNY